MQFVRKARHDPEHQRLLMWALGVTVLGNSGLALGKGIVAYLSGSTALYADAVNSVSDVLYSFLMALGLWLSRRPPDLTHPQGHSRFEPLAGLTIAVAMTVAGYEAMRAAVVGFAGGGLAVSPGWPMLTLLLSATVKAAMYESVRRLAKRLASPALQAAARDNLSDVLASLAAVLGTLGSSFIHPLADPIGGALVGVWILRSALGVWVENLRYLTGGGAAPELRDRIVRAAQLVPGVVGVHQVITEYVGPKLVADLHINVDGNISLFAAHAISDAVQECIEEVPGVDRAYVHVEPYEGIPEGEEQSSSTVEALDSGRAQW